MMRITPLAIVAALAIVVSSPASAAKKRAAAAPVDRYEACESRALGLGLPHGQTGHAEYVRECMGQRPSSRKLGS